MCIFISTLSFRFLANHSHLRDPGEQLLGGRTGRPGPRPGRWQLIAEHRERKKNTNLKNNNKHTHIPHPIPSSIFTYLSYFCCCCLHCRVVSCLFLLLLLLLLLFAFNTRLENKINERKNTLLVHHMYLQQFHKQSTNRNTNHIRQKRRQQLTIKQIKQSH